MFAFTSSASSSSTTRARARAARRAAQLAGRKPPLEQRQARRANAPGSGPVWEIAASSHASPSARNALGVTSCAVDRQHDAHVVRCRAQPGDDPGDRRTHRRCRRHERKRQAKLVRELADGDPLVARLAERPATRARRASRRRSGRAPSASRSAARPADEQDARSAATRHGSEYTFRRPPRTKPQSVTRRSRASSTARLDGAPTATTIGQPATAAFCTSSNESRPLTQSTRRRAAAAVRRTPSRSTLSIALWRPTSSRTQQQLARGVEEPGRVQPAGRREAGLRLAEPLRKRVSERDGTRSPPSTRGARPRPPRARPCRRRRRTTTCRSSAAAAPGRTRARRPRRCSPRGRPGAAPPRGCRPSERQKPSASSSS